MQRLTATVGLLALGMICAAEPASAQDLAHGTWTGTITPPGGEAIPVTFEVGEAGGALSIVMENPQLGPMEFTDERLQGDELTFWWEPGTRVDCSLTRQDDGGFEGVCSDDRGADGGEGPIAMTPPTG